MEEFLGQIKKAIENKLYLVALQSALTIPDICSKLSIENRETTKRNYIEWYEINIKNKQRLTGKDCYFFRCAMLHEGKMKHGNIKHSRIIFFVPNDNYFGSGNILNINGEEAINIDLLTFCEEMINCALKWWQENKNNSIVQINYETMVKYYNNGIKPFIVGIPVIA